MSGRVVTAVRSVPSADGVHDLSPATLELMERQTIAFLYTIWKAQGVKKKIIELESNGYKEKVNEDE